jgi:hypothetical protein
MSVFRRIGGPIKMSRKSDVEQSARNSPQATRRWIYASALAILALGMLAWRLWPQESLEAAASKVAACMAQRNYGCLVDYVSEHELSLLRLSRPRLREVVEQHVVGSFDDALVASGYSIRPAAERGKMTASATFSQNGQRRVFSLNLALFDEGPRVVGFTRDFLYCAHTLRRQGPLPQGEDKVRFVRWSVLEGKKLENLGLRGTVGVGKVPFQLAFETWDERIRYYDKALAKIEASKASGS